MKHSNRVKVQRLLRILKVRCILLLHDYRAGLPDQNKLWFRHTLSFDDVRQPNSAIWRKIRNEYIFLLKCDMARSRIQNIDFKYIQDNIFQTVGSRTSFLRHSERSRIQKLSLFWGPQKILRASDAGKKK